MNDTTTQLDAEELLHFAIQSSQNKENEKAILYLKHALQIEPNNAKLHYFLGAQHAEIGMFERAVEEMATAVNLDPNLETAHFQLGLLYATSGRIEEAAEAWRPLDKLGDEHPLYLFKAGLLHLAKDEFSEASENLLKGIKLNTQNPDLNNDMQRILDNISQINEQAVSANIENENKEAVEPKSGNHVFLSAYNTDKDEDESSH